MFKKLIMVTDCSNHNKEYIMTAEPNDNTFVVRYGRVGARYQQRRYPMSQWDSKYREKINKGYVDVSDYYKVESRYSEEFKKIPDSKVANLVDYLIRKARQFVKREYNFEISQTTTAMIKDVQRHIDMLMDENVSVWRFNDILLEIFQIIPRKMGNVKEYLAKDVSDYPRIIENEQKILDAMAGQVYSGTVTTAPDGASPDKTILENSGIEIRPCTPEEEESIKKHLTAESAGKFKQAFYVRNIKTEERFNEYCKENDISKKDVHFFYHGSLAENFWSIITMGLTINPNARIAGKMFGFGTYFATRARKSLRYTDIGNIHCLNAKTGFLAVYKVAYKKPMDVHVWKSEYSSYRYANVKSKGYDAVFAHAGQSLQNDEIIVYQDCQSTIRYLVEMKA